MTGWKVWAMAFGAALAAMLPAVSADMDRAQPQRMQARIDALSQFGRNADGGVDRVAYSQADIDSRAWLMDEMRALGLDVRIDAGGNIIGARAGREPGLKPIVFGSHTDSVPGGGNYDGDVGVIAALEVIELLNDAGHKTRHPLEVINFSNEEGGLVGSLAYTGRLKAEAMSVETHAGMSIAEGIRAIGGNPDDVNADSVSPGDIAAFLELHIEQGAVLYRDGTHIGVVEGIVGIGWWDVTVEGFANHAGTTPMAGRRDAMVAASRLTLAINRIALEEPGRQVATVGRIKAFPGAPNVIPGRVEMSLEIRDLEQNKIDRMFSLIRQAAAGIASETGTDIGFQPVDVASHPAPTDPRMRRIIAEAAASLGYSARVMPSGAGHDAQDMVTIAPTGMIFVPSKDGISHSPQEYTAPEDMARGADVLLRSILEIDAGALTRD
ncbi:Zn-dependent hydrolase [Eilatimonas milleporae]|uniref:N-carbamoyl-L-amino-acid hydrolase n=1 Tax=Eilatimonas milleporae TaxID=911205 RepID=A0A3M0CT19_9PROT|nr:Zn-dependent hydrolase [Eilatimonas milleporae]RMB12065.1 N-carbamoyl-L-amino-acid hydrolase [Eilatimonas milleporae]